MAVNLVVPTASRKAAHLDESKAALMDASMADCSVVLTAERWAGQKVYQSVLKLDFAAAGQTEQWLAVYSADCWAVKLGQRSVEC